LYSEAGKPEHLLNEDGLPLGYTMEDFFPLAEHYSDSGTETPTALSADSKLVAVGNSHGQVSLFTFPKSELWKTISDPSLGTVGTKADGKNIYTRRDELGHIRTFTQPCGSPLPPGTTCTCDCVPTAAPASTSSDWTTTCSCNTVCTCVPVYR